MNLDITLLQIVSHILSQHPNLATTVEVLARKQLFKTALINNVGRLGCSIVSQNCVGGRLYELLGQEYTSPTVGLWFDADGFLDFTENLRAHLAMELERAHALEGELGYPVGRLGGVSIYFQHYRSFEEARTNWIRRAKRVDLESVVVLMTDRDGFLNEHESRFECLPFDRKLLFSHRARTGLGGSAVHVRGFESEGMVGNLYDQFEKLYSEPIFSRLASILCGDQKYSLPK